MIRAWLHRLLRMMRRIAGLVSVTVMTVKATATRAVVVVVEKIRFTTAGIRQRHMERLRSDTGYRTAITAGISALLGTLTPQPVLAAALGLLVSEHLGGGMSRSVHDEEDEHGLPYGYDEPRRSWQSPRSGPLWDRMR